MPVTYANVYPAVGDAMLGCRHCPDPWDRGEACWLFMFKRPVTFTGIRLTGALDVDVPMRWFVACVACAAEINETCDRQPARLTECIQDLAGPFGWWPDKPRVRFMMREGDS